VPPASPLLAPRQRAALTAIAVTIATKGYPPTVRELGSELGLSSPSSVHAHLRALERRGFITREAGSPRATQLTTAATTLLAAQRSEGRAWRGAR
jgi:repressor LexA